MTHKPKIVVFDIETAPIEVYSWDLWPERIPHTNIIKDWYILCIAWKELGKPKVDSVSCFDSGKKDDDYNVVKKFRDILEDVDVLIGHNSEQFDVKKFNSRLIFHGLPPLPKIVNLDTKKLITRVARFTSHKLDHLTKVLGHEGKIKTDFQLWIDVVSGKKEAMKEMVYYCIEDVRQLEKAYFDIRPYLTDHPVIARPFTTNCPRCDSSNTSVSKTRMSAQGIYRKQFRCNNCGSYFTSRKAEKEKSLSR